MAGETVETMGVPQSYVLHPPHTLQETVTATNTKLEVARDYINSMVGLGIAVSHSRITLTDNAKKFILKLYILESSW